jgi:CRISPR-associated protein Cas2
MALLTEECHVFLLWLMMTTLYLDRKGLELRLDGAALALYEMGSRTRTVPPALLDRVVIRAETLLTSSVLGALAESGCAVVVLSGRHGRRLGKVHRYLKGHAIPVQYSVFVFQGSEIALECVLSGIAARIEPGADDVRAYHLPARCEVTMLGRQQFPEGVVLGAHGLDRLLRELTANDQSHTIEAVVEEDLGVT